MATPLDEFRSFSDFFSFWIFSSLPYIYVAKTGLRPRDLNLNFKISSMYSEHFKKWIHQHEAKREHLRRLHRTLIRLMGHGDMSSGYLENPWLSKYLRQISVLKSPIRSRSR